MSEMGRKREATTRLMLKGLLGIGIGLVAIVLLSRAIGFDLGPAFWVAITTGIPMTIWYLWHHRSHDNTRFDIR